MDRFVKMIFRQQYKNDINHRNGFAKNALHIHSFSIGMVLSWLLSVCPTNTDANVLVMQYFGNFCSFTENLGSQWKIYHSIASLSISIDRCLRRGPRSKTCTEKSWEKCVSISKQVFDLQTAIPIIERKNSKCPMQIQPPLIISILKNIFIKSVNFIVCTLWKWNKVTNARKQFMKRI